MINDQRKDDKRKRQIDTIIREKLIRYGKIKRCHLPGEKRTYSDDNDGKSDRQIGRHKHKQDKKR